MGFVGGRGTGALGTAKQELYSAEARSLLRRGLLFLGLRLGGWVKSFMNDREGMLERMTCLCSAVCVSLLKVS